jgi:hypothetical protein
MDSIPAKTKQEIFQMMQQQQQGQAQAENAKMQMELGKTMIAKGIMPNGQPIPGQQPQAQPQPAPLPSPVQQIGQPVPQAQNSQQTALAELMAQQIQHQGEKIANMEQVVMGQGADNERTAGVAVEAIDTMKELQSTLTALTVAVGNLIKPPGKKVGKITRDDGSESIVELIDTEQ